MYYHLNITGATFSSYLKSYILLTSVFLFITWCYYFLSKRLNKLSTYFRYITLYNFFLVLIAIPLLIIPVINELFWYFVPIHPAIPVIPRLKLLVYEPSFYSFQLVPIFLFYLFSVVFNQPNNPFVALGMVIFALILSLSFGVIGSLIIATTLIFGTHFFRLSKHKRVFFFTIYLVLLALTALYIIWTFFPFNPIFIRLDKMLEGNDSSTNGRTWQAFLLAWRILQETDYYFGAGLGQIKEVGHQIIVDYYNYEGKWADLVRIPNTMAETLATFGIVGAVVRLVTQIVLFVHTRVYTNYYRLTLFAFVFIFQFMGSYLTNIYEYVLWLIVFLPVFPQFDKKVIDGNTS